MAKDELIDSHVSIEQCKKAVDALTKHALKVAKEKAEKELIPGKEENIWLVLSVKKTTVEKKLKPFKIPLAHPIVDPRETSICLITKDPQREYKDLVASHNIKFISRVVGVEKLKGKFKPFEARRMLLKENGLFLADERVVPLLPGLLGKLFFQAKKQPIPVSLTRKDLKGELERAVSSTYMHQNQGTCTSVKVGTLSQSAAHIVDNLKVALPAIVKRIHDGWDNIQSFHIKTNSSVSLPIWSCGLGEGEEARWSEPQAVVIDENWTGFGEGADEEENKSEAEEEQVSEKKGNSKKGKKRTAEAETETPVKKVKKSVDEESKQNKTKTESSKLKEDPASSSSRLKSIKQAEGMDEKSSKTKKSAKTKSAPPPEVESASKASEKSISSKKPMPKVGKPSGMDNSQTVSKVSFEQSPSITPEEIKKKKILGGSLERKKEKITKGKGSGSVKESIIGKKAKSRT